jgi:Tfp pilus assembly PilM family ATPase
MTETKSNSFAGLAIHPTAVSMLVADDDGIRSIGLQKSERRLDYGASRIEGLLAAMLGDTFDALVQETGMQAADIGIALHQSMVLVKKIPSALGLGEDMVKDQMRWEATQFLLAPLSEYALTYERLPFATPSGNPLYLEVLVRKSIVQALQDFFRERGLTLKDIDVDVFSNVRTVLANYEISSKGTVALVEVQPEHLSFTFVHNREYFLSHRIPCPGDANPQELDPIEIQKGLLKELRRLVFGHRLGKGPEDLEALFLSGHAIVRDLAPALQGRELQSVQVANPFRRLKVQPGCAQSEWFQHHPETFSATVGLALKRVAGLQPSQ